MKYNIIGDIHGRKNWRKLVREDTVNIFVGDYVSPYDRVTWEDCKKELMDIVELRKKWGEDKIVLLIGNHDLDHWKVKEHYSRFDYTNEKDIEKTFEELKNVFKICYGIGDKVVVSHAGITREWFFRSIKGWEMKDVIEKEKNGTIDDIIKNLKVEEIVNEVNNSFYRGEYRKYNFMDHCNHWDYYGTTPTQSPLWIRPETLKDCNLFFGDPSRLQVHGHTQVMEVSKYGEDGNLWCVDCLGYNTESLIIDINDNEEIKLWKNQESTLAAL